MRIVEAAKSNDIPNVALFMLRIWCIIGFLIGHRPNGLRRPVFENGDIAERATEVFSETLQPTRECEHFTCDCFIIMFYFLLNYCCTLFFFNSCIITLNYLAPYTIKKKCVEIRSCTSYPCPLSTIAHLLPRMLRIKCLCSKLFFGLSWTILIRCYLF